VSPRPNRSLGLPPNAVVRQHPALWRPWQILENRSTSPLDREPVADLKGLGRGVENFHWREQRLAPLAVKDRQGASRQPAAASVSITRARAPGKQPLREHQNASRDETNQRPNDADQNVLRGHGDDPHRARQPRNQQ
jgi:hypothetical protein